MTNVAANQSLLDQDPPDDVAVLLRQQRIQGLPLYQHYPWPASLHRGIQSNKFALRVSKDSIANRGLKAHSVVDPLRRQFDVDAAVDRTIERVAFLEVF